MSASNDGGPAFPTPNSGEWGFNSKNEKVFCPDVTPGMTLRDWFAGMALNGIIERDTEYSKHELLEDNYETAKQYDADGNLIHIQPAVACVYIAWEPWYEVAEASYALADAMLAAREGRKP